MFIELDLAATCCVESNGQEEDDEETDIGHVSWFDNANFSSPKSQLPSQKLLNNDSQNKSKVEQWQNDHKNLNTCPPDCHAFL